MPLESSISGGNREIGNRTGEFSASGPQQVLVRSRSVVARRIAGETLIVPVRGKVGDLASMYSLNKTGSLIWDMLENPTTISELIGGVAREFDVKPEHADADVKYFLREMIFAGLAEVSTATGETGPVGREGMAAADAR